MSRPTARLARLMAAGALLTGLMTAATAAPATITLDGSYLEAAKERIAAQDASLQPAFDKLRQDATALLAVKPESVTYKKLMPPSGSKHDYMSLAPYWWPDPAKPDGLPYIQKDGQFNPSSKNGDTDSVRMQLMCMGSNTLALAWHFTGDMRYAAHAASFIRTWFLDPQTRMNPNLKFGQAVMGRVDGRGIGLIDTRNLWMVIDAAALLESSGALKPAEVTALKAWFRDFTTWMRESDIGIDEFNAHNNHGTFYDMQVANYALFFGDTELARRAVNRGMDLRIASQISIEGKQYAELERTTPFHYSAFNLDAMTNIARYGEQLKINVWKKRDKTRGLKKGIDYLVPFVLAPETWPYKELKRMEQELALPLMLKAERGIGGGQYAAAAAAIPELPFEAQEYIALYQAIGLPHPTTRNALDLLMWPVLKR